MTAPMRFSVEQTLAAHQELATMEARHRELLAGPPSPHDRDKLVAWVAHVARSDRALVAARKAADA